MYMRIDLISDRHPQALALRNLWETLGNPDCRPGPLSTTAVWRVLSNWSMELVSVYDGNREQQKCRALDCFALNLSNPPNETQLCIEPCNCSIPC